MSLSLSGRGRALPGLLSGTGSLNGWGGRAQQRSVARAVSSRTTTAVGGDTCTGRTKARPRGSRRPGGGGGGVWGGWGWGGGGGGGGGAAVPAKAARPFWGRGPR